MARIFLAESEGRIMTPEEIVKQYFKEQIDQMDEDCIRSFYVANSEGELVEKDFVGMILRFNKEICQRLRANEDSSN
ncbi:MAG: hypothetical protein KBT03_01250 [Bacteroidales bacterium]|nr:hypothetical protein [Candidatus Scybalousia scybalohippi]